MTLEREAFRKRHLAVSKEFMGEPCETDVLQSCTWT